MASCCEKPERATSSTATWKDPEAAKLLAPVLIRKRFWRTRELLPTQERALYLGPSWVYHGHWVEREDGSFSLTRMVMHSLVEPPKDEDWIGLEDELAPTEVRRRIRGKVSLNHLALKEMDSDLKKEAEDEEFEEEETREEDIKKVRKWLSTR